MALSKIKTNSIEDDAVTATQIAADAVGSSEIATGAVDTAEIATDAVDSAEIATDAVTTSEILDANVTLAKIADQAANTVLVRDANSTGVVSAKAVATTEILIGDGTGFTAAALSGDTTMTNAGAVTIADNAVTLAKLEDGTQGDILYYGASGVPTRLGVGTSGQFLQTLGASQNPAWAAATYDDSGLQDDIALLGFKVAANGSLAKYNLVDQTIDDFQDASGINSGASTAATRSPDNYVSGSGTPSGGTITTDGGSTIHTFTADGDFVVGAGTIASLLLVGGGGGGGKGPGGGGGGGGVLEITSHAVTQQTYAVVVGSGGTGGIVSPSAVATSGGNTTFDSLTGFGGGFEGANGGSGGGGGGADTSAGASTQTDQGGTGSGNSGGNWASAGSNDGGGGGGGSSTAGTTPPAGYGGAGGTAMQSSISGSSVYYGAGGGGGSRMSSGGNGGAGGTGGGGAGGQGGPSADPGANATGIGAGGGGGGLSWQYGPAKDGGDGTSGQAIFKYTTGALDFYNNMILVSANQAAQAAPTKGDIVFTYTNGAGSTTLGTDVTAEISADGGSTWTAMTLGSEGSTGSHNIATAHDVTITSTITSPWNMAYRIKTFNQTSSKTTRIQAVSLGWS